MAFYFLYLTPIDIAFETILLVIGLVLMRKSQYAIRFEMIRESQTPLFVRIFFGCVFMIGLPIFVPAKTTEEKRCKKMANRCLVIAYLIGVLAGIIGILFE